MDASQKALVMTGVCSYNNSMNNKIPLRSSVRILLINQKKEILLMCADDPKTTADDGVYHGKFWFVIGGMIEQGETLMEAAIRELKEETGLDKEDVIFGRKVWFGEFDMILFGKLIRSKQQFIVAHTVSDKQVTTKFLTTEEKQVIEKIEWFSLDAIRKSKEIIYPVMLEHYLPDILEANYPIEPLWIDLGKKPDVAK